MAGDLRERGAWSLPQRVKNDAIYALVRAALFGVRPLSRDALVAFGRALGAFGHAFGWRARALGRRNITTALPALSEAERRRVVRQAFVNLGGHLAEVIATLWNDPELLVFEEASRTTLATALAEGRGVVLPSAHLGPWDRLAATLASAFPMTAIVRESYDPRLDAIVTRARARVGFGTIARGAPGAAARIVRALRSGRVLGIPMDLRTRAPSVMVPFLGADAPTAVGPATLALRTGAPVVVSTIDSEARVTCTRIEAGDLGPKDARELTRRINQELGKRIGAAAAHWPWMHERRYAGRHDGPTLLASADGSLQEPQGRLAGARVELG